MSVERIIVSGNCYWCVEAMYQKVSGCTEINPGFFYFKSGFEGKVEAVEIHFDTDTILLEDILAVFFTTHNPTLVDWNPQRCAFPLNRSSIIYQTPEQKELALEYVDYIQADYEEKVHTQILSEDCGQFIKLPLEQCNFYLNNPKDGYCLSIVEPKMKKLKQNLSHLLLDKN